MKMLPVNFVWVEVSHRDTVEVVMAMVPLARYAKVAARQFTDGTEYPLVILEARSRASHSAYFAEVNSIFKNLPEGENRFPTPGHLRKYALCQTGWCDQKHFVCDTPAHAKELAMYVRARDTYAIIKLSGSVVQVWEAKSQSAAAMGKQAFLDSKRDVLEHLSAMIGVKPSTVKKEARHNA